MIGKFLEALNFNQLFLKLNRFICNYIFCLISVDHTTSQ